MTDYKTAKEEILGIYSLEDLQDIVQFGCVSGCAEKHSSYEETVKFFDDYENEITEYLTDSIGPEFLTETQKENEENMEGYKNDLAWTFIECTALEVLEEGQRVQAENKEYCPPDFKELFTQTYFELFKDDDEANYYMLVNISSVVEGSDVYQDGLDHIFNTPKEEFKEEMLECYWSEEGFEDFGFDGEFKDYKDLEEQVEWDKVWESIQYSCDEETLKKAIAHYQEIDIAKVEFKKLFCNNSKGGQK